MFIITYDHVSLALGHAEIIDCAHRVIVHVGFRGVANSERGLTRVWPVRHDVTVVGQDLIVAAAPHYGRHRRTSDYASKFYGLLRFHGRRFERHDERGGHASVVVLLWIKLNKHDVLHNFKRP